MPPVERVAVRPGPGLDGYDYADAFQVHLEPGDRRTAEQFARCGLEQSPRLVRATIRGAQRRVLGLRLGPAAAPGHVLGWPVVRSEPDVVQLETRSPVLGRAVIVGQRAAEGTARISTYLFYRRPRLARLLWAAVGPLHRRIAPYLLRRAADG